ncbi:MAG TPA: hypothetical protein VHW23_11820 [Kofleriaceae bacterium]|jgi:hypothetical protein|nr:hypothetical protein [Kofleriaceae bacterium]
MLRWQDVRALQGFFRHEATAPAPARAGVVQPALTPELCDAARQNSKEDVQHLLAAVLASASPGLLPRPSLLTKLANDLIQAFAKDKLVGLILNVTLTAGTMTTLDQEAKLDNSIYTRGRIAKKSKAVERDEQYERMLTRATAEAQPELGGRVATIHDIGRSGHGEAKVAIYALGKQRKRALVLFAHGYEYPRGDVLPSTQRDRGFVFLVPRGMTLTRPDENVRRFHAALPRLAEALAYPEVRETFVMADFKMPAFRLAYHDPGEVEDELGGLAPALKYFDVGVLVFTRPAPTDKLLEMPPFETSVPLDLVVDAPVLAGYRDVVLHICRTPIEAKIGGIVPRRHGTAPFEDVFYSVDERTIYTGRRFQDQMEATEHLAMLPGWSDRAAKAFLNQLGEHVDRQNKIEQLIDTKKIPSYFA